MEIVKVNDEAIGRVSLHGKSGIVGYAFVDVEDYHDISKYNWNLGGKYAITTVKGKPTRMHIMVMKLLQVQGKVIDHIDGDGLNNRKNNLRHATINENNQNKVGKNETLSGYRGVILFKAKTLKNPYLSKIVYENVQYGLGMFADAKDAAKQYDTIAYRLYGEHAMTNNLLSLDEIKECLENPITKEEMQVYKRKVRELPTGVHKTSSGKFKSKIGDTTLGLFYTMEEAISTRNDAVMKQKEEMEVAHNDRQIERNAHGQAIIILKNIKKQIIGNAIVDDDEWYRIAKHSWCMLNKGNGYAVSRINNVLTQMHRFIMPDHDRIDHINNDSLDNRKENLRPIDASGNSQNVKKQKNCASKYKGVWYSKEKKKWAAEIKKNYVKHRLGYFKTEEDAALAYNAKALELYDKPRLNVIE